MIKFKEKITVEQIHKEFDTAQDGILLIVVKAI
jgi:hypothetical protein